MTAGPGERGAAGAVGRGPLRASDADREQAIDSLKAAFVQGLTRDQLAVRAGRALVSRTYAELAAATDGIPAGRPASWSPDSRSRWDAPGSRPARRWLRGPRA